MAIANRAEVAEPVQQFRKTVTEEDVLCLLNKYRLDRDERAREALVVYHRPLVEKVARRFVDTGEPMEDLVQEGYLGMLTAIDLFDTTFSVKFSTYAHHLITGQIRHYLRDKGTIIREPAWSQDLRRIIKKTSADLTSRQRREPTVAELAGACNITEEALTEVLQAEQVSKVVSLDGFTEDDAPAVDPDKIRSLRLVSFHIPLEERIVLEDMVSNLKLIEQRVVHEFFFQDLSQTEIAKALGVSCNYVSHLLKSAVKKMGKSLAYTELQERQLRQKQSASGSDYGEGSIVDRVTGLYTQDHYVRRMEEEIVRAQRYVQELSTVWVRCVNFDEYSNRLGSEWGERTLFSIGAALRDCVRRCDVGAYIGDAVFAVILPHTGEGARMVRDRLLSTLSEVEYTRGARLEFRGASLIIPQDGSSAREICDNAEYELSRPLVAG
ncbi:MAG TPA: sigma-70 family RNA polymerase sigma factor [Armatimonadota bacterium]|jgi:RNA polymerase sigma-B factor